MHDFSFRKLDDPPPPAEPPRQQDMEVVMLRLLETKVRRMFSFSGWDDGVDEDAAHAVREAIAVLDWIAESRRRLREAARAADSREDT